jgi:transformation/transcription domain-associated protein
VKYGSADGRNHLARVLYLLSFDNQEGTVGKAFDKYGDNIPHWVWLSWIPQLLLALQRPEAQHCKAVLVKLATVFPQVGGLGLGDVLFRPIYGVKANRAARRCS